MSLKINPIVATLLIAGVLVLIVALIKGCSQSKLEVAAKEKAILYGDSIKATFDKYVSDSDSSTRLFQDSLGFERGQNILLENQKQRTEIKLDKLLSENKKLIAQHKLAQYADTTATLVPHGFIVDCKSCFTKLEATTNLTLKYKSDYTKLKESWDRQDKIYQNGLRSMISERQKFNEKISYLTKQQQESIGKLKPHGRLYLSWGVLWSPLPIAAGGGLMYQNKRNLIYGLKGYYGKGGTTIETTVNFPLSLRF